ncbi:MAG: succinate dehydrogenase assembly factor 2 [Nevskia sp.]|uniref:FAD assembly factor SdhE n=1 Tax=uncultured Nevskia sp. TaxID=228950 RepID=UPI0025E41200|nr:succinate dehydrogenase assembly factor 2 [uncultured Nevskia sp.]MDP3294019.1 succinate dehydrogenase assembly factor 2 [Nevskia sp.]
MSDLARLRFLCRRGMKELDVLFGGYLARHYETASPDDQWVFLRLLECEDPDLWAWIIGQTPPPAQYAHVIEQLQRND